MAALVYVLCAVTSLACALLLARGWLRSRMPLLLWSSAGFAGMAVNNAVLVVDRLVLPDVDLSLWRLVPAAVGMLAMLAGLILDGE
jgi:phosphatidylserine synthase